MRRVYYDLTGLPPTPEEVDAFLADASTDAYERVVDRLLDSPRYGERWGRHWLDLVRYADTNSFERDGVKPNAWRYRDYVIRSFNDDKPYDQFIREQLAGDELPEVTNDTLTATGYYRLGLWDDEPADPLQARYDELDDIVATTGTGVSGPDGQLRPLPRPQARPDSAGRLLPAGGVLQRDRPLRHQDQPGRRLTAGSGRAVSRAGRSQNGDSQNGWSRSSSPASSRCRPKINAGPKGRSGPRCLKEKLQAHLSERGVAASISKLQTGTGRGRSRQAAAARNRCWESANCLKEPPQTFVLARGNPHVPGARSAAGVPDGAGRWRADNSPRGCRRRKTSGRRRALAEWIASPANPLTARVMVNRRLAASFRPRPGPLAEQLRQPRAIRPRIPSCSIGWPRELVDGGWRLKPLHRLIVTSSTYRMSSAASPQALAEDPENDLFWRFDMRRLTAEEVRDSMLAVSGQLNLQDVRARRLSQDVARGACRASRCPATAGASRRPRSSIAAAFTSTSSGRWSLPILAEFDVCDTDSSCAARFSTTQPTQALAMLNGEFAHEQAAALAASRAARSRRTTSIGQVDRALRLALAGPPSRGQVERGLQLIETLQDAARHDGRQGA